MREKLKSGPTPCFAAYKAVGSSPGSFFTVRKGVAAHPSCSWWAPWGQSRPRGRSWNQRASDDDPTFRCAVYADLLVADQVADEQRRARVGRTSLEHRIGEWGETRRVRVRVAMAHNRPINPPLNP